MFLNKRLLTIPLLIAVLLLQDWVCADTGDSQEHFRKGHKYYLESKPDQAEVEFKQALELDPNLSDAHYYLGSIYFKQSRYQEAVGQCRKALKICPQDLKGLIILGLSLRQMGLNDLAIATFKQAAEVDSQSAAAHSALGLAYCAQGELGEAEKEYIVLKEIDVDLAHDLLEEIEQARTKQPICQMGFRD